MASPGFSRETYRATEMIEAADLPARFGGRRAHSTAVDFLPGAGTARPSTRQTLTPSSAAPFGPGFDFADFDLADRAALLAQFPQHRETILRLAR
jgi:predicted cupin superfamily sugar epimerase